MANGNKIHLVIFPDATRNTVYLSHKHFADEILDNVLRWK